MQTDPDNERKFDYFIEIVSKECIFDKKKTKVSKIFRRSLLFKAIECIKLN